MHLLKSMIRLLFIQGLVFCFFANFALADVQPNIWEPLVRMQQAAEHLNYRGVYVYQTGELMRSSRLIHLVDQTGTHEKLEMLDGKRHEYIRHNDEIQNYHPDSNLVVIEKRHARKHFPSLSIELNAELEKYYTLKPLIAERVAGLDCDGWSMQPRDSLRYGYRLWADHETGLLLKIETIDEKGNLLEQSSFTDIHIGEAIDRNTLEPSAENTKQWRRIEPAATPTSIESQGWIISAQVPGFRRVHEFQRLMPNRLKTHHIVMSDGVSAISIFISPYHGEKGPQDEVLRKGSIHMTARHIGDYWVTVLGNVPAATIKMVIQSIDFQPVK